MTNDHENIEIRQVRRERRLKKKRQQMVVHGRSLARIYHNAVMKRLRNSRTKKK